MVSPGLETSPPLIPEVDELVYQQHRLVWAGLESIAQLQKPILEELGYYDTSTETLSRYGLALIIEVGEFLNETPWKAWKKGGSKSPNLQRITEEFVDMLSFVGHWINFMNLLGISTEDISRAYQEKLEENNKRFGVVREVSKVPV